MQSEDKGIDLSFLSENESVGIIRIIQRDFEIRAVERNRLRKLKIKLDESDKRITILSKSDFNETFCVICFDRFIFLFRRRQICCACRSQVCKKCCDYIYKFRNIVCKVCQDETGLMAMSCEWFYKTVDKKFGPNASFVVVQSLSSSSELCEAMYGPQILEKLKVAQSAKFMQKLESLVKRIGAKLKSLHNPNISTESKQNLYDTISRESKLELQSVLKDFAQVLYVTMESNPAFYTRGSYDIHHNVLLTIQEDVEKFVGFQIDLPYDDALSIVSDVESMIPGAERGQFEDLVVEIIFKKAIEHDRSYLSKLGCIDEDYDLDMMSSISSSFHKRSHHSLDIVHPRTSSPRMRHQDPDLLSLHSINSRDQKSLKSGFGSKRSLGKEGKGSRKSLQSSHGSQGNKTDQQNQLRSQQQSMTSLGLGSVDSIELEEIYISNILGSSSDDDGRGFVTMRRADGQRETGQTRPGDRLSLDDFSCSSLVPQADNDLRFIYRPEGELVFLEGDTARIDIEVSGKYPITVFWYRVVGNKTHWIQTSERIDLLPPNVSSRIGNYSLVIWGVGGQDTGNYLVVVVNQNDSISHTFKITVKDGTGHRITSPPVTMTAPVSQEVKRSSIDSVEEMGRRLLEAHSSVMDTAENMDTAANQFGDTSYGLRKTSDAAIMSAIQFNSNLRDRGNSAMVGRDNSPMIGLNQVNKTDAIRSSNQQRSLATPDNKPSQSNQQRSIATPDNKFSQSNQMNRMNKTSSLERSGYSDIQKLTPLALKVNKASTLERCGPKRNTSDIDVSSSDDPLTDPQECVSPSRGATVIVRESISPNSKRGKASKNNFSSPIVFSDDDLEQLGPGPQYFFPAANKNTLSAQTSINKNSPNLTQPMTTGNLNRQKSGIGQSRPFSPGSSDKIEEKIYEMAASNASIQEQLHTLHDAFADNNNAADWSDMEKEVDRTLRSLNLKDEEIDYLEQQVAEMVKASQAEDMAKSPTVSEIRSKFSHPVFLRRDGSITGRSPTVSKQRSTMSPPPQQSTISPHVQTKKSQSMQFRK